MRPATNAATSSVTSSPGAFGPPRPSRSTQARLRGTPSPSRSDAAGAEPGRVGRARGDDPLLTVAEAGDYLGTGERFIRRLITERRITYVKIGKFVRLQRSALDAFIEAGWVVTEEQPP